MKKLFKKLLFLWFYLHSVSGFTQVSEHLLDNNDTLRYQQIKALDDQFKLHYEIWWNYGSFQRIFNSENNDLNAFKNKLKSQLGDSVFFRLKNKPTQKIWKHYRDLLFFKDWQILLTTLQIDTTIHIESIIESNISFIRNPITLQYLIAKYDELMSQSKHRYLPESIKQRNYELLKKHLTNLENESYVYYKSNYSSKQALKEIDVYLDNDIFMPADYNKDCDYTGGGKITISTDYLAPKWINPIWLLDLNKNKKDKVKPNLLSYQSASFGLTSFTPYIHYRNNYKLADTLFQHDRPFGSYVYVDVSKYRLWPKGLVRHHGSFQLGAIGTNGGKAMQTTLHKAYGWEKQIANGGRWLIQLNHEADFMLFSSTNRYKSVFKPHATNHTNKNFGINLLGTTELLWGGYISSLGAGIKLSSTDFLKQSGTQNIKPFKNTKYGFALKIDASLKYRYIIHNSLLEGYGYWTTFTDEIKDDDKNVVYTINDEYYNMQNKILLGNERRYERTPKQYDNVNRNVLLFDYGINIRFREMILYYYMGFYTREYKLDEVNYYNLTNLINDEQQDFYLKEVVPKLQDYKNQKIYGYGRIGVSWIINTH